jgi:uncharacterized DUF497 family protein
VTEPFDAKKNERNVAKHGISLDRAADMDVLFRQVDDRFEYGKVRVRAWGCIDGKAYCLVYTIRDDEVRPISPRRTYAKETIRYG